MGELYPLSHSRNVNGVNVSLETEQNDLCQRCGFRPAGSTRNAQMTRKFLSLLAILYGLIYFFYESWYHLNFGQSVLNLSIDYLAIILLLVAGTVNLKASNGEGLLCGAWGFTACLTMRAYAWRHDTASLGIEESKVMSLLIFAIAVSTVAFAASLIQSFPRSQK